MDALMNRLMLNPSLCLVKSAKDAIIHYDKICRTCLGTDNLMSIFNTKYENMYISKLLEQHISIQVQENDALPTQICGGCMLKLINCCSFSKMCLQTQLTLKEIIKYNEPEDNGSQNPHLIKVPFVFRELLGPATTCKENGLNAGLNSDTTSKSTDHTLTPDVKMEIVTAENQAYLMLQESNNEENQNAISIKKENDPSEIDVCSAINEDTFVSTDTKILPEIASNETLVGLQDEVNKNCDNDIENDRKRKKPSALKRNLVCNVCKAQFDSLEKLRKHCVDKKHVRVKRKMACYVCGKLCGCGWRHLRTHVTERPYKCSGCSKSFTLSGNLQRHMKIHSDDRSSFICEVCGKGYSRLDTLNEHKIIHSGNFPYACNYCGATFNHVMRYRNHIRKHKISGELEAELKDSFERTLSAGISTEHKCVICQKVFKSAAGLYAHRFVHGDKTFSCSTCGKKFCSRVGVYNHSKIHGPKKSHSCQVCGKTFSYSSSMKTHMLVHTGEKPFCCKMCSKSFKQRTHLRYHMRIHSGEKPFVCNFCGKNFALKGNLTVHVRTHTGETPFVCEVCDRGFHDSSSLKKHKKIHL